MRMSEFTEKETALALRWLRAKQWLDRELESNWGEPWVDEHGRGMSSGYHYALLKMKGKFFLDEEEAAEVHRVGREMGF